MTSIEDFAKQEQETFLDDFLFPWLRIPSISSDDSCSQDTLRACAFLQEELQSSGFRVEQITLEKGNPAVYAEKIVDPALPTVLVYGHYDVQPINQPDLWQAGSRRLDPFEPEKIGDRIYARGATDDKGQLASYMLAMRYFKQTDFPCNIKFIVEGNEEGGDSTFYDFIRKNQDLLACDAVLISDTGTLEEGRPALTTSLKGLAAVKVMTRTPESLVRIIHASHDPSTNRTLLNGFYDPVLDNEIDSDILGKFGEPPESMGEFIRPEKGYSQLHHRWYRPTNSPLLLSYANPEPIMEKGQQTIRITARGPKEALHSGSFGGPVEEPALNISHLLAGLEEEGVRYQIDYMAYGSQALSTSIQPAGEVQITINNHKRNIRTDIGKVLQKYCLDNSLFTVKDADDREDYFKETCDDRFGDGGPTSYLSYRLVPDQDPEMVYQSIIELIRKTGQEAEVQELESAAPFMTDTDDPYCRAVIRGLQQGYGTGSVHMTASGGSIPITHTLHTTLKVPVILAGFSSPNDNLHAPNESILAEKGLISGARSVVYSLQNILDIKSLAG